MEIKIQLKVIIGLGIEVEGGNFLFLKSNLVSRNEIIITAIGNIYVPRIKLTIT